MKWTLFLGIAFISFVITLIIASTAKAGMMIVDTPSGEQQEIKIGEGGDYFDQSRIVWHTDRDGPVPKDIPPIGGLEKCNKILCVNPGKKAVHDAAVAARIDLEIKQSAIDSAKRTCFSTISNAVDNWATLNNVEQKIVLRCLVRHLYNK